MLSARIQRAFRQGRIRLPLLHQTGLNLAYSLFFLASKIILVLASGQDPSWDSISMITLKGFLVRMVLILTASALLEVNSIRRVLGLAATRDRSGHGTLSLGALGCWAGMVLIFLWGVRLAGHPRVMTDPEALPF